MSVENIVPPYVQTFSLAIFKLNQHYLLLFLSHFSDQMMHLYSQILNLQYYVQFVRVKLYLKKDLDKLLFEERLGPNYRALHPECNKVGNQTI